MVKKVVSRNDLIRHYGEDTYQGFAPTHYVELRETPREKALCSDYVRLQKEGPAPWYAFKPGAQDPSYYVLETGLWKSLDRHGVVVERPVKYREDYVAPLEREGYVYFIQQGDDSSGPIKIGWSHNVSQRLAQLQTANPTPLRLLHRISGSFHDEQALHKKFASYRLNAEWFEASIELLEYIRGLNDE